MLVQTQVSSVAGSVYIDTDADNTSSDDSSAAVFVIGNGETLQAKTTFTLQSHSGNILPVGIFSTLETTPLPSIVPSCNSLAGANSAKAPEEGIGTSPGAGASAKVGHVADQAHKTGQAADAMVAGGERLELGRQVEVFTLNAHRHRPSLQ